MNKRHRLLSAAAAATLGLAGLIGAAAPAHAANQISITVGNCSSTTDNTVSTFVVGDTLSFEGLFGSSCDTMYVPKSLVPNGVANINRVGADGVPTVVQDPNSSQSWKVTWPSLTTTYTIVINTDATFSGTAVVLLDDGGNNPQFYRVSSSSNGGGGGSSSDSSSAPAPVIQQFGMPATGTCDEAQPEGLNLAGVPSGGWGVSWAQWMNGGTGGAVCTRTLNYSTVQSKWVVN